MLGEHQGSCLPDAIAPTFRASVSTSNMGRTALRVRTGNEQDLVLDPGCVLEELLVRDGGHGLGCSGEAREWETAQYIYRFTAPPRCT